MSATVLNASVGLKGLGDRLCGDRGCEHNAFSEKVEVRCDLLMVVGTDRADLFGRVSELDLLCGRSQEVSGRRSMYEHMKHHIEVLKFGVFCFTSITASCRAWVYPEEITAASAVEREEGMLRRRPLGML